MQKPLIRVVSFGEAKTGKTTLLSALTRLCEPREGRLVSYEALQGKADPRFFREAVQARYQSESKRYLHVDCYSLLGLTKELISYPGPFDGALWVVRAGQALSPQMRKTLHLLTLCRVPALVVYLNQMEPLEDDLLDQQERDLRDALQQAGYRGDETLLIRGDAKAALEKHPLSLTPLLEAFDRSFFPKRLPEDRLLPLRMMLEESFTVSPSTIVAGRIEQGRLRVGDEVELVGAALRQKTRVLAIRPSELPPHNVQTAEAGAEVSLSLLAVPRVESRRGWVLAAPDTVVQQDLLYADLHLFSPSEGGTIGLPELPLQSNLLLRSWIGPVTLSKSGELYSFRPTQVGLRFPYPMPITDEMRFALLGPDGDCLGVGKLNSAFFFWMLSQQKL